MLPTSALQLSPPPLHASNCPKRLAVTPKGDPCKPQKGRLIHIASLLFFLPCETWKLQCVYHDSCELQSIQANTSGLGHTWWSPHTNRMDSRGWEGVSLNSKKVCMWSGHALRLKWLQVYTHAPNAAWMHTPCRQLSHFTRQPHCYYYIYTCCPPAPRRWHHPEVLSLLYMLWFRSFRYCDI